MAKMDGWIAPRWVDFDMSDRSDIDEYFNAEHEEHEPVPTSDAVGLMTPTSNQLLETSKTPISGLTKKMEGLSCNSPCRSAKKSKSKTSMTPRTYVLSKACSKPNETSTPRVVKNGTTIQKEANNGPSKVEENLKDSAATSPEAVEILESNPDDDECAEQNRTLVPATDVSPHQNEASDTPIVSEKLQKQTIQTVTDPVSTAVINGANVPDAKVVTKIPDLKSTMDIPDAKETTDISDAKGITDIPDAKETTDIPDAKETTDISDAKETTDILDAKETTDISDAKDKIKMSDAKDEMQISHAKNETQIPDATNEPKIPDAKIEPKIPNASSSAEISSKSKIDTKPQNAPAKSTIKPIRTKPPPRVTVLTSQARRQSTSKYRRASNKYVSLAEAVSKFQNETPERFRSRHRKEAGNSGAISSLPKGKHAGSKLTCATSPLLRCKYRTRAVSTQDVQEQGIPKLEENCKNGAKSNLIKQSVQNSQRRLKDTASILQLSSKAKMNDPPKKNTKLAGDRKVAQQSEKLIKNGGRSEAACTQNIANPSKCGTKKLSSVADPSSLPRATTMNPPKAQDKEKSSKTPLSVNQNSNMNLRKSTMKVDNKPTIVIDSTSATSKTMMNPPEPLKRINSKSKSPLESSLLMQKTKDSSVLSTSILPDAVRKHTPCKKTVPTVVSTEEGLTIKDVEIRHFGIPVVNNYKKITETVPFSFQSQNKKLPSKKEPSKNLQAEEEQKSKPFHARPVPPYVTKLSSNVGKPTGKTIGTIDAPFSFQRRDEMNLKKKKEMIDQAFEREKQARIFHAKPAPKFKPVIVRGRSSENLRSNNLMEKDKKVSNETIRRGVSQGSIAANCENTAPNFPRNQPKIKESIVNLKLKKSVVK